MLGRIGANHGGIIEDLTELRQWLNMCCNKPEKFAAEATAPIITFCRYKVTECAAIQEFYSLLRFTKTSV
jgi:hypothetical protein